MKEAIDDLIEELRRAQAKMRPLVEKYTSGEATPDELEQYVHGAMGVLLLRQEILERTTETVLEEMAVRVKALESYLEGEDAG